jgi:hypothetical protein
VPIVIGGSSANVATGSGAFIGGGSGHDAAGTYAVIGGGFNNNASNLYASVLGGQNNVASNVAASVLGGSGNVAGGSYSVAAGRNARALDSGSFVFADNSSIAAFSSATNNSVVFRAANGVGINTNAPQSALHVAGTAQADAVKITSGATAGAVLTSDANGLAAWQQPAARLLSNGISPNVIGGHLSNSVASGVVGATIAGGGGSGPQTNFVGGSFGTIGGGAANRALAASTTVAGGSNNVASGISAAIGGGEANVASGNYSWVGGGLTNRASTNFSGVAAGLANVASGVGAFVGGGTNNVADNLGTVIAGGFSNRATNYAAVVSGGNDNAAGRNYATVSGGNGNRALGIGGTVVGGIANTVTNHYATVAGGLLNVAGGFYSFAAGNHAQALHDGSFVWGDGSTSADIASTQPNQFVIRASGGVGIGAAPVDSALDVEGAVHVNDFDIYLRTGIDRNHGVGWYGSGKLFASVNPDGPVLYGYRGGILGSTANGQRNVLQWTENGVGIGGVNLPGNPLSVEAAGTQTAGAAGFLEVVARFRNTLAEHTAVSIDAAVNRDPVLYFAENGSPHWSLRHDADDARKFQLRYQYNGANQTHLTVTPAGSFGFGTINPTESFHVASPNQTVGLFQNARTDGTWLGLENNGGGRRWNLISTGSGNGEGAGHLLFHGNNAVRAIIRDDGYVGIGTTAPGERLELGGYDTAMRMRNYNDPGGAFLGDTWSMLQLGMYNPSASSWGVIPPGVRRSFFGMDNSGQVGSLANNYGAPIWRNILDDGSGNMSVNEAGSLNFGAETRQMVNLWYANYGIGVQNNTFYSRTDANFAWYRNGSHTDTELSSGGGTEMMRLTSSGLLVNGSVSSSSDRNVKRDITAVNPREVLEKVASLPITTWTYTNDASNAKHLGPMAQEFHAAFGLGSSDKHIASVDADGVALAAIQALNAIVREKESRIAELERRLAATEKAVAAQQSEAQKMAARLTALERTQSTSTKSSDSIASRVRK